jgi:hypothetical protein
MMSTLVMVGTYVASVETAEYCEYVESQQSLVAAGDSASPELQERTELLRVRAVRAAQRYPAE